MSQRETWLEVSLNGPWSRRRAPTEMQVQKAASSG
jgi:hypothetical protein